MEQVISGFRGHVFLEVPSHHVPGVQVSQNAFQGLLRPTEPRQTALRPAPERGQGAAVWAGCGPILGVQPRWPHADARAPLVWDGGEAAREAEQAVGQAQSLGMGGMSLSDSDSKETENSISD